MTNILNLAEGLLKFETSRGAQRRLFCWPSIVGMESWRPAHVALRRAARTLAKHVLRTQQDLAATREHLRRERERMRELRRKPLDQQLLEVWARAKNAEMDLLQLRSQLDASQLENRMLRAQRLATSLVEAVHGRADAG